MAEKPTIPDFPNLPDFGHMITQACEVVASVRGIPYDFNGTLSLENKFVVLFKTVKEMFDAQDELVKSYKALHDFVNQYFTNLDVQNEVNKKIQSMAEDGSLLTLIAPTVSNKTSEWLRNNITNPANPPIDKSLTVENAAADAKITGVEINAIKEIIYNEVLRTKVGFFDANYKNHDLNNARINSFYMTLVHADQLEKNHYPTTTLEKGENGLFCVLTLQPTKPDTDGVTQIVMTRPYITGIKPRIWIRNCIYYSPTATLVGWSEWVQIGTGDTNTIMKANNICYNKESIKNDSPFDLNKKYLSRIYEFDVDFDKQTVLNAPFYPFRGTLVVFSPGEPVDYSGDSTIYYGVGTVQMVFKSRSVSPPTISNYDGAYYIRCYVSGSVGNETWTEWKEYRPYEKEKTTICKNLIQCFENFCVVGDSISGGYTNIGTSETIGTDEAIERGANWPQYMSIDIGRPVLNLGIGGSSAKSWRNGLKSKLEKKQCYFLYLGGNDMAKGYPLGSESDIVSNYESNVDSYYGNYDYMVRYIHTIAPNAIIFCISNTRYDHNNYKNFNVACKYVANLYEFCHYIDINVMVDKFTDFFGKNFNGHFSPIGYNFYGKCIQYTVNEYMYNNPTKFLGIPYTVD